jgi:hypothetical protein
MVYKSLLLSLALTIMIGYAFTAGLTNPNSWLKKLPEWTTLPLLIGVFVLYLLAAWWGYRGLGEHRYTALFSLGLCVFGIGLYVAAFTMELGHGKARPGQYDYDFSRLDPVEKAAFMQIVLDAGLTLQDATFTEHWHLAEPAPGFRVCVQKGHITALRFSGKKITELGPFSQLPELGDLYLEDCGLTDMSALHAEKLDRLELANNQIADLRTLAGCPNVRWLGLRNNRLQSDAGIELFTGLVSKDLSGNPF